MLFTRWPVWMRPMNRVPGEEYGHICKPTRYCGFQSQLLFTTRSAGGIAGADQWRGIRAKPRLLVRNLFYSILIVVAGAPLSVKAQTIVIPSGAAPRVVFGADRLRAAL